LGVAWMMLNCPKLDRKAVVLWRSSHFNHSFSLGVLG
jgi:hypothetical protein